MSPSDTQSSAETGAGKSWLRRPRLRWIVAAVVLAGLAFLLTPGNGAGSSTLSRGADGWWALRAYLEARGTPTLRLDRPLDDLEPSTFRPGDGVLVLALPFQRPFLRRHGQAVGDHLRAGGTLLLGYEYDRLGEAYAPGLWRSAGTRGTVSLRDEAPLAPRAWWSHRTRRWSLDPTGDAADLPGVELPALDTAPAPPTNANVLYTLTDSDGDEADGDEADADADADATPLIFTYPHLGGRVVVVPSALFSNAELHRAGNADLAESLRRFLDGPWTFDEYHHGFVAPELARTETAVYAWDQFVWHLALVYALGVWALARRFGPAWREPTRRHGSTAAFLRSLGGLHDRLGHHRDAARLLVERAHELEPRPPEELRALERRADDVVDGEDLVRLARRIS